MRKTVKVNGVSLNKTNLTLIALSVGAALLVAKVIATMAERHYVDAFYGD